MQRRGVARQFWVVSCFGFESLEFVTSRTDGKAALIDI